MAAVSGKFVSFKVSTVRFKPVANDSINDCDIFTAGSWDNKENFISVWKYNQSIRDDGKSMGPADNDPKQMCRVAVNGDVTDMKYLNNEILAVASSTGNVSIFKHQQDNELKLKSIWNGSHHFHSELTIPAPCTAIDTHNDHLVSVGEDGRLIQYSLRQQQKPLRTIDEADSCSMMAVAYLKQNEVVTANMQGQLKIWDLRSASVEPVRLMIVNGDPQSVMSVACHPTQPSILACGTEDGNLCIWDLRQDKFPLTTLSAHDGPTMELKFHPTSPNHLFTCSMDGMIWHWDSTSLAKDQTLLHPKANNIGELIGQSSPWLMCGAAKHHLDICSLIPSHNKPINSLDIVDNVLICGSDNEAIYIINNLKLV